MCEWTSIFISIFGWTEPWCSEEGKYLEYFSFLQEEKFVGIRASVDKAKEAVSLDTNDGMSWYVLGTAYLSLFFISNQKWVNLFC